MLLYDGIEDNEAEQKSLYKNYASHFGFNAKGLGWHSEASQKRRFGVLLEGLYKSGTLLDVGCGFGDLYDFISQRKLAYEYFGVDMIEEFVNEAKARVPHISFTNANIAKVSLNEQFDFVVSSGIFAYTDSYIFEQTVRAMWEHTRQVMAFNFLANINSQGFLKLSINEALGICKTLNPSKITYKDGYIDSDTTFWVYK